MNQAVGDYPNPVEHAVVLLTDVCKGNLQQAVEIAELNADFNVGKEGVYWEAVYQTLRNLQVEIH